MEQALSPDWSPASSTCWSTPQTATSTPSPDRINIHFNRIAQVAIDEDGLRPDTSARPSRYNVRAAALDLRRLPFPARRAEHVGRPQEHRISDSFCGYF